MRGWDEEATKQALILPMLDALGYDIWYREEVCPEYEADFATKKAGQKEKVDTTPSVSLAILTNGIEYRFFTDTGDLNVMDPSPFDTIQLDAIDPGLEILVRFAKPVFSPEAIRDYATELNYTAKMVQFLRSELDLRDREPSENLVRWVMAGEEMYDGRVTANVVERFCPIAKTALQIVLRDIVRRSVAALDQEVTAPERVNPGPQAANQGGGDAIDANLTEVIAPIQDPQKNTVITTERELECFALVKELFDNSPIKSQAIFDATARKEVPVQLAYKDTTGYFGIYLNKPSWWVLRIVVDVRAPWIGFKIAAEDGDRLLPPSYKRLDPCPWAEYRVAIETAEDIRALGKIIIAAFQQTIDDRRVARDARFISSRAATV